MVCLDELARLMPPGQVSFSRHDAARLKQVAILAQNIDPYTIFELAGGYGFSTMVCLDELYCNFYTCEKNLNLTHRLANIIYNKGILLPGEIEQLINYVPKKLSLFIMDSEHTAEHIKHIEFCINSLWTKIVPNGYLFIHDMIEQYYPEQYNLVLAALNKLQWAYIFTGPHEDDISPLPNSYEYENIKVVSCSLIACNKEVINI